MATVALLSDTHSFLSPNVAKIVANCDFAVHAGDIGNAQVLNQLNPKKHWIAVRGNNDSPALWHHREREEVDRLDHIAELSLPGGQLIVEHGHRHGMHMPDHEKLRRSHPSARIIVYGHSHKLICDVSKEPWVVNPGAAGKTRTHGGPSCIVLSATPRAWKLDEYRFDE